MKTMQKFRDSYWVSSIKINAKDLGEQHSRPRVYFFMVKKDVAHSGIKTDEDFNKQLQATYGKIEKEYKGTRRNRTLQHSVCVCVCVQPFSRNELLFSDGDQLVKNYLAYRAGRGTHGDVHCIHAPLPGAPKWIAKTQKVMKELKVTWPSSMPLPLLLR